MSSSMIKKAQKFNVLVVLAIMVSLSLGVFMYQGNEVSLNLDGEIIQVVSYSKTVEEFIESENIPVKKGAYISLPLDTKLRDESNIVIKNLKNYTVDKGNMLVDVTSYHTNIKEILTEMGIKLEGKDYTFPEQSTNIKPNTTIEIYKFTEALEVEEYIIPFEVQINKNKNLDAGITNKIQEGVDGLRKSQVKKEFVNGVLNSSIVLKDEIVSEPIPQITERGTKEFIATSRGDTRFRKVVTMTATAYDLSFASCGKRPGDRGYGITASGTKARPGAIAVDPRVIPLGTRLYIESLDGTPDYGFATAEDKGGAIKGNKVDLFFHTAREVTNFGRRKVKVYILE